MSGPYESEEDAYTEVRDIYSGHAKRGVMRARTLEMLLRTCAEHGVELGGYDRRVLGWLAAQPPETAQVIADLIARAAPDAAPGAGPGDGCGTGDGPAPPVGTLPCGAPPPGGRAPGGRAAGGRRGAVRS